MTLALYGKSRRRQGGLLLAGLLAVLVAVLVGTLNGIGGDTQRALADGDDSPAECWLTTDTKDGTNPTTTINAPAGKVVDWLCIKSGDDAFGDNKHSGKITSDGSYGDNNCYTVAGLGTAQATVTRGSSSSCHNISHVDYQLKTVTTPKVKVDKKNNDGGSYANPNDTFDFEIELEVVNGPTNAATTMTDGVPGAFTINSVNETSAYLENCGVSGQTVTCTLTSGTPTGKYKITINVTVKNAPGVCGDVENTASITGNNVDSKNASDGTEVEIPCVELQVCKRVEASDYSGDGNAFTLVTKWGNVTEMLALTDVDEDDTDCTGEWLRPANYQVPPGSVVSVEETALPANWSHESGYPQVSFNRGTPSPIGGTKVYVDVDTCGVAVESLTSGLLGRAVQATVGYSGPDCVVKIINKAGGQVASDGKIIVKKVGKDIPTDLLSPEFSGTVTGPNHSGTWKAVVGGTDTSNFGLADGDYQVGEDDMPMTVTGGKIQFVGFQEVDGEGACPTPGASNYKDDGSVSIDDNTKTVCVLNKFVADPPACVDYAYNDAAIKNFITSTVNADGTASATLSANFDGCDLPKVRFSLYELAGNSWNSYQNWSAQVHLKTQSKELVKGQAVAFDLRPFEVCNYQLDLYLTDDPDLADDSNMGTGEVGTPNGIHRPPPHHTAPNVLLNGGSGKAWLVEQGNRCIEVCKLVDAGSAEGGAFTLTAGGQDIPTGELKPGESYCKVKVFKAATPDNGVNVNETLPGGWLNAGGFPQFKVEKDGQQVSSGALGDAGVTITVGGSSKVTIINKSIPRTRSLEICKVVVGNGDGYIESGTFNFDVREAGAGTMIFNGVGGLLASEPSLDTEDVDGTEVCVTKQVPATEAIEVVEWGSRPDGWVGDDTGYPMYSIDGVTRVSNNTTSPIVAGSGNVKVTFYNKADPRTREITITKQFVELPDGFVLVPERDYPTFNFNPAIVPAPSCTPSGTNPVTWTCTVPADWDGTVTETPKPGWEKVTCERSFAKQVTGLVASLTQFQTRQSSWEFCNRPLATIIVKKVVTNIANDPTQFTVTLNPGAVGGQIAAAGPANATFNELSAGSYTVTETAQNGYNTLGWALADSAGVCPAQQGTAGNQASVNDLAPGETAVVCFYNERFGNVVVDKAAPGGTIAPGTSFNWTITASVGTGPTSSDLVVTDTLPAGFTYGSLNAPAPWSCSDSDLSDRTLSCTLPAGTGMGSYTLTIPVTVPVNDFTICGDTTNTVSFSGAGTSGTDSATVDIGCTASDGQIRVRKVVIGNPANTTEFTANLTGPGITGTATEQFSQQNVGFFLGLGAGTFTVAEQPQLLFTYNGWAVGTITTGGVTCPAAPANSGNASVTLSTLSPSAAVCFYNTPVIIQVCTNCVTIVTPTPTPTTPTVTPEPSETPETPGPSETPETPAITPETTTPGPTEDTAGARTPGPGQTPIAPSTGNGFMGTGAAGANMLLALVGLLALSLGTTILALGRKSSRR